MISETWYNISDIEENVEGFLTNFQLFIIIRCILSAPKPSLNES